MDELTSIIAITGILVGTIAIVLVIFRWYTATTLYTDRKR